MTDTHAALLDALIQRIESRGLNLPTLPDVALQVRTIAESQDSTAQDLVGAIARDPAIATRLVQIANSPLYRGLSKITSLPQIVSRLGMRTISQLVVSISIQQSFRARTPLIAQRMRKHWEFSIQVAALSQMLARRQRHLDPDQALLAGLTHAIGALPVYAIAEELPKLLHHPELLDQIATELQPRLGGQILRAWDFPDPLVQVVLECQNVRRAHDGPADYVDVVIVAILQARSGQDSDEDRWSGVVAAEKLGVDTGASPLADEMDEILRAMLD
ncbi:MAG: HDOD domain-containing protein [Gammaproteobacteria bacterium]|nr:HDOD domain-containing protein [Gammaproteobacteria bacterium]